jgi:hypothetical protein
MPQWQSWFCQLRASEKRGDTSAVKRLQDAIRLTGVILTSALVRLL